MTNAPLTTPAVTPPIPEIPGNMLSPGNFAANALSAIGTFLPAAFAVGIGFLGLKAIVTGENPLNGILGKKTVR